MSKDLIWIQRNPGEIVMYSAAEEINYGQFHEAVRSLDLPPGKGHYADDCAYELVETEHGDVHTWTLKVDQ